jgi:patatin-like phospholipase/acyl hydrolase
MEFREAMETFMTEVKRLLSIHGGGIRGVMAADILVQIEDA